MSLHRTWMFSLGLSLVIATLGAGQGLGEPGPEVGRDEAVAAIRGLRGRVRYDEKSPDKTESPRRLGRNRRGRRRPCIPQGDDPPPNAIPKRHSRH